jgi:Phospholipase_D-nuclease N-terminal
MTSRHADIAGCWAVFLGLPVVCAVDAAHLDRARWSRARRSKPAWIAVVAYLPALGPLLYVAYARPKVAGATAHSRVGGAGEPPIGEHI